MFPNSYIEWYAIVTASPIVAQSIARALLNIITRYIHGSILDMARPSFSPLLSAQNSRLISLYQERNVLPSLIIAANAVALCLQVNNAEDMANRSGVVASVNLALLLAGAQFDVAATFQGDSLRLQLITHRDLSSVMVLTVALHVSAAVVDGKVTWDSPTLWGFVVSNSGVENARKSC